MGRGICMPNCFIGSQCTLRSLADIEKIFRLFSKNFNFFLPNASQNLLFPYIQNFLQYDQCTIRTNDGSRGHSKLSKIRQTEHFIILLNFNSNFNLDNRFWIYGNRRFWEAVGRQKLKLFLKSRKIFSMSASDLIVQWFSFHFWGFYW